MGRAINRSVIGRLGSRSSILAQAGKVEMAPGRHARIANPFRSAQRRIA